MSCRDDPKPGPSGLKPKKKKDPFPPPSSPYYSIGGGPTPPGRTPTVGMTPQYDLGTPSYNPEELDIAPGSKYYGYNTSGHGITPGYSGPSPDGFNQTTPQHGGYSPVYSGPPPGTFSGASTPGNDESSGYTPQHSGYTPHYSGYTPSYGVTSPAYSPGNATPLHGGSTPGTPPNNTNSSSSNRSKSRNGAGGRSSNTTSPQIQQAEITGNTTPHPGTSGSPAPNEPRYLW